MNHFYNGGSLSRIDHLIFVLLMFLSFRVHTYLDNSVEFSLVRCFRAGVAVL